MNGKELSEINKTLKNIEGKMKDEFSSISPLHHFIDWEKRRSEERKEESLKLQRSQNEIQEKQIEILKNQEEFNVTAIITYSLLVIIGGIAAASNYMGNNFTGVLIVASILGLVVGVAIGIFLWYIIKLGRIRRR